MGGAAGKKDGEVEEMLSERPGFNGYGMVDIDGA